MPATGKPFEMETMYIIRLDDESKIAEHWGIGDMVSVMGQLGLLPAPASTP
jgi:predicted ester cyclase